MFFKTIRTGQQAAVWDQEGNVEIVHGPRLLFLVTKIANLLQHFSAGPDQYLKVIYKDGRSEHKAGPCEAWLHPVEHEKIEVVQAIDISAHQAVVIYRNDDEQEDENSVERRVLRGPARYVPGPTEWLHEFSWHGADPNRQDVKIPHALQFTKLRVIPDQMYFDVANVRTADDALVVIKVMIFFELNDIECMMDQTHDPVADFINALTADVIDHVGRYPFDEFKEHTAAFNDLTHYPQLTTRAEHIGYRINKVVYRGYRASKKLQEMHDQAIETRTALKLEDETERQAQEIADLKLEREHQRALQEQDANIQAQQHRNAIAQMEADQQLAMQRQDFEAELHAKQETINVELQAEKDKNTERLAFLQTLKGFDVNMTQYLIAQYQHPDKLIRIDGHDARVHMHEHDEAG